MRESDNEKVIGYMREHWPSEVCEEWKVGVGEYAEIVATVMAEWTKDATRGRKFLRLAGQSGSGKTTQLLPVANKMMPGAVLVAARKFVKYHPHVKEIETEYGKKNLRTKTNEFSTIMMMLTLKELIGRGYNIVLDVTLLDVLVEDALQKMLAGGGYEASMMMMAVSKEISDGFAKKRMSRVVAKETADEFWRAQNEAVRWYAEKWPKMEIVVWSAFDLLPVYVGDYSGAAETIKKCWEIDMMPKDAPDEKELLEAKLNWVDKKAKA